MTRIVVCLTLILCVVQGAIAQTTFHGDNARTGAYQSPGIKKLKGVKWKFKTDAPVISSPVISNGVVFVGSVDTFLYAIDQATGQQKWKFGTNGSIQSSPAVADGVVYFGTYEGLFYAVDEKTGTLKWKFAMEYEKRFEAKHLHGQGPKNQTIPDDWDFYLSSPAVFNNRVYFGSGDKNVYALNAKTGAYQKQRIRNNKNHVPGADTIGRKACRSSELPDEQPSGNPLVGSELPLFMDLCDQRNEQNSRTCPADNFYHLLCRARNAPDLGVLHPSLEYPEADNIDAARDAQLTHRVSLMHLDGLYA